MMSIPPVAKSLLTHCKKCESERYHRVLAHVGTDSAKVECEICHKKSTFRATKNGANKTMAGKTTKPKSAKSKKTVSAKGPTWGELKDKVGVDSLRKYKLVDKFDNNSAIEHPKFGIGFVVMASEERIDAVFEDGLKTLIHNRK